MLIARYIYPSALFCYPFLSRFDFSTKQERERYCLLPRAFVYSLPFAYLAARICFMVALKMAMSMGLISTADAPNKQIKERTNKRTNK